MANVAELALELRLELAAAVRALDRRRAAIDGLECVAAWCEGVVLVVVELHLVDRVLLTHREDFAHLLE